jgi:hypothetical protein
MRAKGETWRTNCLRGDDVVLLLLVESGDTLDGNIV